MLKVRINPEEFHYFPDKPFIRRIIVFSVLLAPAVELSRDVFCKAELIIEAGVGFSHKHNIRKPARQANNLEASFSTNL